MNDPAVILDDADSVAIFLSSPESRRVKTWAYVRVSTSKQMREGLGQEGQIGAITQFCEANNLDEPVFIVEVSSGGKPLLQVSLPGMTLEEEDDPGRPLLGMLLASLCDKTHQGATLMLWKLDRLSRISTEQEMLLRMLAQSEVRVRSTDAMESLALDGNVDPTRLLIRQIMGAFAQYERHLIQMRMQLGIRAKAARGEWAYGGQTPYGYRRGRDDLIIDETEAFHVVAVIYLRQQGFSYREISRQLDRRWGIKDFNKSKAQRICTAVEFYEGAYIDAYGVKHARPDLRILPRDLATWADEHDPFA